MALKLIYPLTTRIFVWIQLASRDETAKNIEILILRHQLAVAQRRDPHLAKKLTWTDRAWLTLLAGLLPHGRLHRIRLIVAPGTILRWHRDLLRRRWARRSQRKEPGRPPTQRNIKALILGSPRKTRPGATEGSTASWPDSASVWRPPPYGRW